MASPIKVNVTCPLALSLVLGVYSTMVFKLEEVKFWFPPLLFQLKLVTLLDKASEVKIIVFSQIVWEVPANTLGLFWIGIVTCFETAIPQGAIGCAVTVKTIWLLLISKALGVTIGFGRVLFEMNVPVVEVQI